MKREQRVKGSLLRPFLVAIVVVGAIGACSAGGSNGGHNGNLGVGGNGVANGRGGSGNDISFIPSGGDVGIIVDPGRQHDSGVSAGGAVGTANDGHVGPSSISTCADTSKFKPGTTANRLLYPYDGTIFPRGLPGPLMMWDAQADQILIEAKSSNFSYVDCPMVPDRVRYQIPKAVWDGAGSWSNGAGDPLVVKITTLTGGTPGAPITVNLKFALATMKGAIYYNTYGSKLANSNGAILKLLPGADTPTLFLTDASAFPGSSSGPCRSCHALSANGMVMTANHHTYPGTYISESYDVTGPAPTLLQQNIPEAGFAGIFPDGSRLMTNGPPNPSVSTLFPTAPGDVTALTQSTSKLLDPKTAQAIPTTGWDVQHAQMPMFSPDGKHIVYNDADKGPTSSVTVNNAAYTVGGHSLWVQDFAAATNTFSNPKQIYSDPTLFAAWPFFTPDSKSVVFAVDTRPDFTSQVPDPQLGVGGGFGPPVFPPTAAACAQNPSSQMCPGHGHLMVIDLASGKIAPMDTANGYLAAKSYLSGGAARDNEYEFFPTVTPISAGGFFWVLFTSRRTYGNLWTKDIVDPTTKKIWVTAIDIDAQGGVDPSHPAFYLPGQETETGNIRAFGALEPCKEDGAVCSAGSECCKGFCSNISAKTGLGVCGKVEVNQCARLDDKCTTQADCCTGADNGVHGAVLYCIGGFCAEKQAH